VESSDISPERANTKQMVALALVDGDQSLQISALVKESSQISAAKAQYSVPLVEKGHECVQQTMSVEELVRIGSTNSDDLNHPQIPPLVSVDGYGSCEGMAESDLMACLEDLKTDDDRCEEALGDLRKATGQSLLRIVPTSIIEAEEALHEFDFASKWGPRFSVTRSERLARLRAFSTDIGWE